MKPPRVLHVLGGMNCGGVESWLMNVLRHVEAGAIHNDILVHTDQPGLYDGEVLALGSRILRCPHVGNPPLYAGQFLRIIKQCGPFDVLHSHVHHFSGFVLALGRIAGIPVRIAHSHSDTTAVESKASPVRKIYLRAMKELLLANCTQGFAVSEAAAAALFGSEWHRDHRLTVLYCGIDLAPFRAPCDSSSVRAELGFCDEDVIFGHVGRFSPVKNHFFFLKVAAYILQYQPRAKFLLVGDGPLRPEVEKRSAALGLTDTIVFAGPRQDIPRLMMGAMDVLLMPSAHEGLPLVLMEAQAAGLPCIASDVITKEATVNPTLIQHLPLAAGPREWARVASETAQRPRCDQTSAVKAIDSGRFDIRRGVREMSNIYFQGRPGSSHGHVASRKVNATRVI